MDGAWGSVEADWKLVLALIIAWYVILRIWEKNGVLDRWNATRVFGVVLMVRSNMGLKTLDRVARPRRFWRLYGEVSLWVCLFSMFIVAILLILVFITSLISPPSSASPPTASELVAIPGINPMIPLGWGQWHSLLH